MSELSKSMQLLDKTATMTLGGTTVVVFGQPDDDGLDEKWQRLAVSLTEELWQDFGAPEQLTVTVEPGDALNG